MKVCYNKLWKLLIDKGMKKSQLRVAVGASKSTFAKLGKNENVTLPVLLEICEYLNCDFSPLSILVCIQGCTAHLALKIGGKYNEKNCDYFRRSFHRI